MGIPGNYLRVRRREWQLSQRELAFLLGYKNESIISRLERQERRLAFDTWRAVHGLHAQAKPKAYQVTESDVLAPAALAAWNPAVQAAQTAAGGRSLRTTGRIVSIVGTAPKRVSISEWPSVEQAQAWENSEARNQLAPQRDKAIKIIRQYIVEAANLRRSSLTRLRKSNHCAP